MPTITQDKIDEALKRGYTMAQIQKEATRAGALLPGQTSTNEGFASSVSSTPYGEPVYNFAPIKKPVQTYDVGQQSTGVNAQGETTYNLSKPTIATSDNPVIGNEPATNVTTTPGGFDTYEAMTPEQRYKKAGEIYMKGGKDITDEEKQFMAYAQFQGNAGKDVFGLKTTKSSGTTTYSPQLNRDPTMYQSSVKNDDGTYTVTYKDGATQVITESPTKTIFPEGTPEYYAQKQADEAEKRVQVLTEQANKAEEKRKKDTEELVAKYGENIATQLATQKADIEANGAKRMDALNTTLSFSGFGRSSFGGEKRDEIAKNIEATINQAKAKADLELMAYRMEREGADAEAISAMRTNIANVQQKIDDANYANQLKIIELNQQNATTGAEAMNNLLATMSDSEEIVSNADIEKSQLLGYFVNKDGSIMLDSQKRPIQFEGNPGSLDPSSIGAYADALSKGIIDEKGLDKLSPADKAAVLKHVSVQNDTYTPPVSVSDFIAKEEGFRDKAYWDVNGWAVGYGQHSINGKPVVEGQTITKQEADADLANRVANARFNKLITVPLSESQKAALYSLEHNVGGGVWGFASIKPMIEAINKGDFNLAADILVQSGVGTRNAATKEVLGGLVARRQREADLLRQSGGGQTGISNLSKEAQGIIAQINSQGGKPTDYILGTNKDSQALLQEVIQGLNAQGGSGTLASETRTQSLDLAQKTIDNLLDNKDLAGSFQTRRVGDTGMGAIFNLTANENVNFVNRVDALAGQLMQIDGPTLKAIFGPQISNSDIEMIKKTILQGLDPRNQNPAAFEKTLNDVKAKMQAYINRLPQNQNTGTTPTGQTGASGTVTAGAFDLDA